MFIGINSQLRRDMLRIALHQFLESVPKMPAGRSAEAQYGEMQADARKLLREISASENLLRQPATHEVPHTQE